MNLNVGKFKKLFSTKEFIKNDFTSRPVGRDFVPQLWKYMDVSLPKEWTPHFIQKTDRLNFDIKQGHVEFQMHTRSIAEHTDDIHREDYFQLTCIHTHAKPQSGMYYDTNAVIDFYDETGKKQSKRLKPGVSLIFNPRKPHSVIYYGEEYGVAMRTVRKVKKSVV